MLAELSAIAAELGHKASFTSDPALVDWVLSLNADTVFYDLDEDDRREEIGRWTHPSERTAQARGDGFSPRGLGFPAPLVRLFFHRHGVFRPGPVRALARRLYLRSMRGTTTVGWIAGPWSTPAECLAAGRMLLRFWLALTAHGLYLQPFGSVITSPTVPRAPGRATPGQRRRARDLAPPSDRVGARAASQRAPAARGDTDVIRLKRALVFALLHGADWVRTVLLATPRAERLLRPGFEPLLWRIGTWRLWLAVEQARKHVPAYRRLLSEHGEPQVRVRGLVPDFSALPITDKQNYVLASPSRSDAGMDASRSAAS